MHDPGKIVLDLAVALALGGDCLADVNLLRAEPALFGPVASDPTVSRLVDTLAGDVDHALTAITTLTLPILQPQKAHQRPDPPNQPLPIRGIRNEASLDLSSWAC